MQSWHIQLYSKVLYVCSLLQASLSVFTVRMFWREETASPNNSSLASLGAWLISPDVFSSSSWLRPRRSASSVWNALRRPTAPLTVLPFGLYLEQWQYSTTHCDTVSLFWGFLVFLGRCSWSRISWMPNKRTCLSPESINPFVDWQKISLSVFKPKIWIIFLIISFQYGFILILFDYKLNIIGLWTVKIKKYKF